MGVHDVMQQFLFLRHGPARREQATGYREEYGSFHIVDLNRPRFRRVNRKNDFFLP
jgi:hypothetical protein